MGASLWPSAMEAGKYVCDLRGLGPESKVPTRQRHILSLPGSSTVNKIQKPVDKGKCFEIGCGRLPDGVRTKGVVLRRGLLTLPARAHAALVLSTGVGDDHDNDEQRAVGVVVQRLARRES